MNEEKLEILKCTIDENWKVDVENGEIYSKHSNEMLKGSWRGNEFYFFKDFIIGGKRKAFNFKKSNVIAYAAGNDLLGKSVIHINGDKQDNRISNLMVVDDRSYWKDEELVFLRFAYPNNEFTTKEIAEALGRSRKNVIVKASSLNLKRPKKKVEEQDMRTKVCSKCGVEKRISCFHKSDLCKDGHRSVCKSCASEYSKIRAEKKSREMGRVWY